MLRRKGFYIGAVIICLVMGYLGYMGFSSSATYYYTVGELLDQESSIYGKNVRVNGRVAPDSIEQESGALIIKFTITERGRSLPAVYRGVVPDAFNAGSEVVIEGYLDSEGIFQTNSILTKCPSKYVTEE